MYFRETKIFNDILMVTLDLLLIVPNHSHQVKRPLKSKPHDGEKVRDEGEMLSSGAGSADAAKARGRCEGGANLQQSKPSLVFQGVVGLIPGNICDNESRRHGVTPG